MMQLVITIRTANHARPAQRRGVTGPVDELRIVE